ncbi:MAG TPA: SpoIIE family protein phosphatase [Solirubrobacteraceae bacterium]|nr:SpoIIE family protein phosphatase [Solirubrobacteraceae bacterium]
MGAGHEGEAARFELLAAIGEVADGSLSFATTVQRLLEIVVPEFADLALLDALGSDGSLRRLGVRIDGPDRTEAEAAVMRRRVVADAPVGVAHAVATSQSTLLSPMTEDHLRLIASSDEDLKLLRSMRLNSALFVPLRSRGRILGAFACGVGLSGRRYDAEDLRFAEVLSGRISLALDNAGLSRMVGELEQQLESTFANLAEAVIVRDPAGRMVFANPAVAELLGFESADAMTPTSSEDLMGLYEAFDESGRRLTLADLPSARALAGEAAEPQLIRSVVRSTGTERWLLHKATPAFDEEGALTLVVNVIEDVTEVKRAELSQRLLAEAGKELSSSMDYEQTLQRVARLAVPQLADWCGVSIRGPYDELEQVAVAHVDPKKVALAREFGARSPTRMSDAGGTAEVIRSGESRLVREITPEMISQADVSEGRAALIRDLQMRSVIIVPLAVPGRSALGAMTLVMAESGRRFEERDLALAEELGRRAAVAVENARLYTERSHIATTLQQSLLPAELPQIDGFQLASLYRAAGDQSDVGGDFYDAFEVPSGWMVVVGDVTGRGPQAAALTSLARYTLRTAARLLDDPLRALAELNAELRTSSQPSLVTIACALLRETPDGTQASVVLAGHPPPYHIHTGVPHQVGSFASPLGAYEAGGWRMETVALQPGDQLVLYTDGVTDTVGHGERFGEERLGDALAGAAGAPETIQRIDEALKEFAQGPQTDDTAVLALERVAAPCSGHGGESMLVEGATPAS